MIAIADSGSSKTDWVFLSSNAAPIPATTAGFNPVYHNSRQIREELSNSFRDLDFLTQVKKVFFYGSGCWDEKRAGIIIEGIQPFLPQAQFFIEHDLLGAARAACGENPGITCILGTGSNSCLYDGNEIIDNVTNLGYLLGDEGSGIHMGKMLIQAYFYRELPDEVAREVASHFPGGKTDILEKVYGSEKPNTFIASFASLIGKYASHPFIQDLIKRSIGQFLDRQVCKYEGHKKLPVHFIGSISHHFQSHVIECCQERGLRVGKIFSKPIDELVKFHRADL